MDRGASPKSIRYTVRSSFAAVAFGLVASVVSQRATELNGIESESVPESIGCFHELLELGSLFAFEEVQLFVAMRKSAEGNA